MSIVLVGSTSGSCTLQEQAVAGNTTLTLPTVSGTILTTGSSGQSIPKAALPTGSVLQVLQAVKTDTFSTSSTTYTDVTGLSISITPTSASSKILVMYDVKGSCGNIQLAFALVRNSTQIYVGDASGNRRRASSVVGGIPEPSESYRFPQQGCAIFLDSPATTSSTTYKVQAVVNAGTGYVNRADDDQDENYRGRVASSITVMEIAA